MITRTLMTGLLAGIAAGVVLSVIYMGKIQPMILAAEIYEQGMDHAAAAPFMRYFDTFLFNLLTGVGFGLMLASAMAFRGRPAGVKHGILWGIAGFAVFVLAPAAGLPPELPGSVSAPLEERQLWWLFAAAATAAGIALLVFRAGHTWRGIGVVLILAPHMAGAPATEMGGGTLPAELAAAYVGVTIAAMAVFWIVLGAVAGWSHDHFSPGRKAPS